jgi:hypothetical protein
MEKVVARKVLDYLLDYVGDMTSPGKPTFDCSARQWRVPVLCETEKGFLYAGEVVTDDTGQFISVPDKDQIVRLVESQLKRLPVLVMADREELEAKGFRVVGS